MNLPADWPAERRKNSQIHFRVAGVALTDSHVLLFRSENDDFWSLPGGHVEPGETALQALVRELREETGQEIVTGPLLWVVENFFEYRGEPHHELGLYFRFWPAPGASLMQAGRFTGVESLATSGGQPLQLFFEWHARRPADLAALPLLPSFLPAALVHLPQVPQHLVHQDG